MSDSNRVQRAKQRPEPGLPLVPLLSPKELASLPGVTTRGLARMVKRGQAPQPIRFNRKTIRWRRGATSTPGSTGWRRTNPDGVTTFSLSVK
jgi:hypothetical protein